ncbi:SDR family NAD(P)-dependent oxidoreductase, partial [Deinococcus pimensis]|uniref:SDR family NAD(P)-dependent oxidoreductase n=1 Tax=Deinococcus pimensis TaxID=309888 RepID=UPI0004893330
MATLIIGATGGIGAATARAWPGEALWLSGRDETKLAALAGELRATAATADLGYESHVRSLFEGLSLPLETIVYAAGSVALEAVTIASGDATRRMWNANYFGLLWALKHGAARLAPGGRFYVLGARPELVTTRGLSQYAASKAAAAR